MRIRTYVLLSALVLAPAAARAQEAATDTPQSGQVDFGGQVTHVTGDEARYEHFRDLRSGALLDGFTYRTQKNDWSFAATATHVGYRDQKFDVRLDRPGRVKLYFTWDQIPLFYNAEDSDQYGLISATPYRVESPGVYRLDDAAQAAVQNGTLSVYDAIVGNALPFETKQRRDMADFKLVYTATKDVDLIFHLVETRKTGTQPWMGSFGFSNTVELPGPVDHRTTDVTGQVEWGNEKGTVRAGYDGSFFHNNVPTLLWDNPVVATDGSAGAATAREPLWPDNSTNGVSAAAAYNLPEHTRVFGNVSLSKWSQNQALVPFANNTSLPDIPLPRATADVSADVSAAYLGMRSRPTEKVWLSARYRLYDYNNTTPEFATDTTVRTDQTLGTLTTGPCEEDPTLSCGAEAFSYTRQYFDADLSYNVTPFTAVRVGYGLEHDKRTFRQFERTNDSTFRASLDTTGVSWLMFRAQYDYSKRTGTGLDEQVFDAENEGAAEARQFDISDRNRNRVSIITSFMPTEMVTFGVSGGYVKDDRPGRLFGLETQDGKFVSLSVDVAPMPKVDVYAEYGYEKYTATQKSRQANPGTQEFDVTRDWTTDGSDRANTLLAGVTLKRIAEKADVDWSLEYSNAADSYLYGLDPNQTIFTSTPLMQLPGFTAERTSSMLNVMYYLSKHLGLGAGWLYETFDDTDFAFSADTLNGLSLPRGVGGQIIVTRYMYRPYTGNTGFFRVRYLF